MKKNLGVLLSAFIGFTAFIFLMSCKKENETLIKPTQEIKNKSFFTRIEPSGIQRPKDIIDTVISICKIDDLSSHFSDVVIRKYGYPRWDLAMMLKNENGLKTLLVPVVDSADRVRLIISAYQQSNDKFLFKMIAKEMQQPGLPKYSRDNKVFTSQSLAGIFNSLEKQVIASKNLSNSPSNEFETNSSNITISWICWTEMWVDENGGFFMTNTKCSYTMIFTSSTYGSIASVPDLPEIGGGGGSGGGGDDGGSENVWIAVINSINTADSLISRDIIESAADRREVTYVQKIIEGGFPFGWWLYNSEDRVISKLNATNRVWEIRSIEHISIKKEGIHVGLETGLEIKNMIINIANDKKSGTMNLNFDVDYSYQIGFTTIHRTENYSKVLNFEN
jgi:hypothetical protein